MRHLSRLREPYRMLFVFALSVLFGVAIYALVDLIMPPHHIAWSSNVGHTVFIVTGLLLLLRYIGGLKKPNP